MAVGRYVLSADIWAELEKERTGAMGRTSSSPMLLLNWREKQSVDAMPNDG